MSPTVFTAEGFRFYFFSREETRVHVHVQSAGGEAKFWLEPHLELAVNHGMSPHELSLARRLIEEHEYEIRNTWNEHFKR
ncbi:MAG: DUF4160 domain-containing protein [Acidobacteria bacterium]|nr:DUF4160 domain-containing protein [Acidobacteriota bacterium]